MTPCSRYASSPQAGRGGEVAVEALSQTWTVSCAAAAGSRLRWSRAGRSTSSIAGPANRSRTAAPATSSQTSPQPPTDRAASSETRASLETSSARPSALPGVEPRAPGSGLTGPAGRVDFMDRVEEQKLLHVGVGAELRGEVGPLRLLGILGCNVSGGRAGPVLRSLSRRDDQLLVGEPVNQVVNDTGRLVLLKGIGRGERPGDLVDVGPDDQRVPDQAPRLVEGVVRPTFEVDDGRFTVKCLRHHVRAVDAIPPRHVPAPFDPSPSWTCDFTDSGRTRTLPSAGHAAAGSGYTF